MRQVLASSCKKFAAVAAVLVFPLLASAADRAPAAAKGVDLFEAMRAGQVDVRLIPKDAKEANVLIENKTKQPLTIKLPDAFAGVPVLAQMGMGGMGNMGGMGMGGMGGGGMGGNQGMGGGMGGMGMGGMGMGGMGMGGGMFNVAPEKVGKLKVPTVCLEHGKRDPNPRVKYELRPIETFTKDQRVIEVCKMLGKGEVSQNTAQAAAWHFTDGLTWAELANKDRVRLRNGYTEKFFAPQEIGMALRVANVAARRAEQNGPVESETEQDLGKYDSLSRN